MTAGPGSSPDSGQEQVSNERKLSGTKETIHSGQFMVSEFEAEEAQDEEGIEVPEPVENVDGQVEEIKKQGGVIVYAKPTSNQIDKNAIIIDSSLTKLFKTMSLAYKQKITSPKWNRFKGLRLRWKDKIRLNNVIWRCWHMQYMQRKRMTVCQFTLDVDIHNRPETIVLEGKYWKRRLEAVTAEYKKWRVYYKNRYSGVEPMPDQQDMSFLGLEEMDWARSFLAKDGVSLEDHDAFQCIDFTDMLFSPFFTSPQLFPFPNPREIARGTGNSDLQQPGLIQLQPDLTDDDMMDFQEMLAGRGLGLPTVFEEDATLGDNETIQPPSPPSISTPVPQAPIEYTARLTATHVFSPPHTPSSLSLPEPTSPHIYSQEPFIHPEPPAAPQPAHQHAPAILPHRQTSQQQPPQVLFPIPSLQDLHSEGGGRFCSRQEATPRPFCRSRSDQYLDTSSPRSSLLRQDDVSSFAMPKAIPRRRSHSGSLPYPSPMTVSNPQVINATSAPNISSSLQPGSLIIPMTSHLQPQPVATPSHSRTSIEPPIFASPDSALLAHLLTSDSYLTPAQTASQVTTTTASISLTPVGNKKVPVLAPRQIHSLESAGFNGSTSSVSNGICSLSNTNGSTSFLTSVSPSTSQQPLLLPNVTLSAVTPSSIKSISNSHFPKWSSGTNGRPIKTSPPYSEPVSPLSYSGVPSPNSKPFRPKNDVERTQYKEHRRVCHINAEQKRRYNIKNNFDMLHSLIPSVNHNPNAKVSKATMLHKGAEYILQLKQEKHQLLEQSENLKQEIEKLNCEISTAQSLLPATGAPMTHTRHNKMRERFDAYIREQTLLNSKYYVMSLVAEPLMETFNSTVSTGSVDDLCRSAMAWLDQHCSLNVLRPVVSNAMRKLSTTTSILTTPEKLTEDIHREVTKKERKAANTSPFSSPVQR